MCPVITHARSLLLRKNKWFSPSTPVSSTNETDRHDITEILLKAALNTIPTRKNVCRLGRTRILIESVRKRNRKEGLANYNKTRINIGHQNELWMELKEAFRVPSCRSKCFPCR